MTKTTSRNDLYLKKRHQAMKTYSSYSLTSIPGKQFAPWEVVFENKKYICLTNGWSFCLTTEYFKDIKLSNESGVKHPDIVGLLRFDGIKKKLNFREIFENAKNRGYKLNKNELRSSCKYLMHYDGAYYKIGLLDITYSIINDGNEAITYHPDGETTPLIIQNDIGICCVMPVFIKDKDILDDRVFIDIW